MMAVRPYARFVREENLRADLTGFRLDRGIIDRQPLPHRGRYLFNRSADRSLGCQLAVERFSQALA